MNCFKPDASRGFLTPEEPSEASSAQDCHWSQGIEGCRSDWLWKILRNRMERKRWRMWRLRGYIWCSNVDKQSPCCFNLQTWDVICSHGTKQLLDKHVPPKQELEWKAYDSWRAGVGSTSQFHVGDRWKGHGQRAHRQRCFPWSQMQLPAADDELNSCRWGGGSGQSRGAKFMNFPCVFVITLRFSVTSLLKKVYCTGNYPPVILGVLEVVTDPWWGGFFWFHGKGTWAGSLDGLFVVRWSNGWKFTKNLMWQEGCKAERRSW